MNSRLLTLLIIPLMVVSLLASCGKKEEDAAETEQAEGKTESSLQKLARDAKGDASLEEEVANVKDMIEAAGFTVKSYENFPAQEVGRKGRMLVYTDKKSKQSGGVVYFKKTGPAVAPCWHWYFDDAVPETVSKVELNDDGLWDVKIVTSKGPLTFIQDDSFTLMAKDRSDWLAMNGQSSTPISDGAAMWLCFDGDSTTAWASPVASEGNAFVEFHVPFGVEEGNLTLHTLATDQPKTCTVFADGKKIDTVELKASGVRQLMHLGALKGAKRVRIVFESSFGGDNVAVSEIALK
ncbi:MAG: hypothetical protein JSW50_11110 [Candidatus Latescibacterota bacterium]|nr:MAG: hypothetical protein JSW50_11110 [Candidatus Latescibacterota bacterium]